MVSLPQASDIPTPGTDVFIVGYGRDDNDRDPSRRAGGILKKGELVVNKQHDSVCLIRWLCWTVVIAVVDLSVKVDLQLLVSRLSSPRPLIVWNGMSDRSDEREMTKHLCKR